MSCCEPYDPIRELTAKIVGAYLANPSNTVAPEEVPNLIKLVSDSLHEIHVAETGGQCGGECDCK